MYPTNSGVGWLKLVLRLSVPYFPPNSRAIEFRHPSRLSVENQCRQIFATTLHRTKKWKYYIFHFLDWKSNPQGRAHSHTRVPLCHDWPTIKWWQYLIWELILATGNKRFRLGWRDPGYYPQCLLLWIHHHTLAWWNARWTIWRKILSRLRGLEYCCFYTVHTLGCECWWRYRTYRFTSSGRSWRG